MDDVSPGPLVPVTSTGTNDALLTAGVGPVAGALLSRLDTEHPVLSGLPARERLLAAAWLGCYRSWRTRCAYAGDLAAWLGWLREVDVDALHARRVHVDLWARQLLDTGAAASSTSRRLSALSRFDRHLVEHDLIPANPATAVRRPSVDPDHTATLGLDRDQARAFIADTDTGPDTHRGRRPAAAVPRAARRTHWPSRKCSSTTTPDHRADHRDLPGPAHLLPRRTTDPTGHCPATTLNGLQPGRPARPTARLIFHALAGLRLTPATHGQPATIPPTKHPASPTPGPA